jgi:hypothetical protein
MVRLTWHGDGRGKKGRMDDSKVGILDFLSDFFGK